jgi:hypothetical protein
MGKEEDKKLYSQIVVQIKKEELVELSKWYTTDVDFKIRPRVHKEISKPKFFGKIMSTGMAKYRVKKHGKD